MTTGKASVGYLNFRLEQVARSGRDKADKIYKRECGIDIQHLRVLRIVAENPGRAVNIVVREALLDRSVVSRIISTLVRQNLIERTISTTDARQFLLFTTTAGEELVRHADILGDALDLDLLSMLDRHELEVFEKCLAKLEKWRPKQKASGSTEPDEVMSSLDGTSLAR